MCPNRDWFSTYKSFEGGVMLMRNNTTCKIVGIGTVQIRMHDGVIKTLSDVKHIPDLMKNLFSLGVLDSNGCKVVIESNSMKVSHGALVLLRELDLTQLWHMHLGHMSEAGMIILSKIGLLPSPKVRKLDFFEHCFYGRQKRVSFGTSVHGARGTLDYIHFDLWGPAPVTSKGGRKYLLTFINDYSKKVWVYFPKHKDEVFKTFKQWKTLLEKQIGKTVKRLRTNNGVEFYGVDFTEYCLRKEYWAEAVNLACYLVYQSPHLSLELKTLEKLW
ncbi:hypothetical protein CRG98_005590 [Punica granatum]|uniref:Uncharacterized protein n=1 Tax=Punica granatum TaxID=22663 RepID=A0A2I0L062_PUNGR|nr:hypothetical protein CRG98_005590 [Punica granatum]